MNLKNPAILSYRKGGEALEIFSSKVKIFSGPGEIAVLRHLKPQRLFLVTDPYFVKSGMTEKLLRTVNPPQYQIFDRVAPDPSVELAAEGTAEFQKFSPDLLVALGGGSSMDCAKAISYFSKSHVPFAAIPTTSGSGSEVTDFAILSHGGVKHPLVDESLQPDYAILDSDLLESLPGSLIADAGFDVLSHALEAIAARKGGRVSDLLANEAFRLAFQNLPASFAGNLNARLPVHEAAALAGLSFNQAGLGLCHAMSHSLGGLFHVPHGRLNAILMPEVMEFNLPAAGHKYAEMARFAGLGGLSDTVSVRNLKNGLLKLRRELSLPETLQQAGVDVRQVRMKQDALAESVMKDPCCETNPVPVDSAAVKRILLKVASHG